MADAGCSVAHAVWVFARRGVAMESFARYRAAGVNMSLGTDTNPQSVIEAMRWAAVCSKIVERNTEATTAAHAFDAATLGGARALGRDDLGRIAPGAKADLVLWKARLVAHDAAARPGQEHRLQRDRRGRGPRLRQRPPGGGRRPRARRRRGGDPRALQAGGERMWPRMASPTGPAAAPTSSRPDLPGLDLSRSPTSRGDPEGNMADSPLSPHTLAEIAEKLAGLSLTPSDLEALGAELETLLDDVPILDALDLGDVEPETLFDMQGP